MQAVGGDVAKLDPNQMFVLPGGEIDGPNSAMVLSTINCLRDVPKAQVAYRKRKLPGSFDGTYKTMNNNNGLGLLGVPALRKDKRRRVVSTLRVLSVAIVPTESKVCPRPARLAMFGSFPLLSINSIPIFCFGHRS